MGPLAMAAIGAGLGILKSEAVDRPKEDRQRKLAAETMRWSPWTGMQAQPIQEADPFGSALKYGMTGAAFGQGMETTDKQNALLDSQQTQQDLFNQQIMGGVPSNSPYAYMQGVGPRMPG